MVVVPGPSTRALAGALVLAGACTRAPTAGSTATPAPAPVAVAPTEPVASAEPRPALGPSPAVEPLVYIARADGEFPSMLSDLGPRMVVRVDDEVPKFTEFDDFGVVTVDDEQLASIGAPRPPALWLLTPEGPCRATLGPGYVGYYAEGMEAYEIGYRIEPCAPVFAPLGIATAVVPHDLRWVPAKVTFEERVARGAQDLPERAAFEELGLGKHRNDQGALAPALHARLAEVEGTALQQLIAADHWPAKEACDEQEVVDVRAGWWIDGAMTWLDIPDTLDFDVSESLLLGAMVQGDVVMVIVETSQFQATVAVRTPAGSYRWSQIVTGSYHDEDVAYFGYSVTGYCGP